MIKTRWGYDIDADRVEDVLSIDDFNTITADKFKGDIRLAQAVKSASEAVRNFCGWHVCPSMPCIFESRLVDKRFALNGRDLMIQLPARQIEEVSVVKLNDVEYTDFCIEASGMIRVFDVNSFNRKDKIHVEYVAGTSDDLVKEIASSMMIHELNNSYGVQSETTGSVSISYNASWVNGGGAGHLTSTMKEDLTPYTCKGVF